MSTETKFSKNCHVRIINIPPLQSKCWISTMDKTCGTTERIIAIDKSCVIDYYLLSNGFYYDKQCFEEFSSLSPNKQKIKINLSGK